MKRSLLVGLALLITSAVADSAYSGKISLPNNAPVLDAYAGAEGKSYRDFLANLKSAIDNGPEALRLIRAFGRPETLAQQIDESVQALINPGGKYQDFYEQIGAKENAWALPLFQYSAGDESGEEPMYERVNRDLRDTKPDTAQTKEWTLTMRQALARLPRFEGVSFRGTRLTAERVTKYYSLNNSAGDRAFISSSLSSEVAFRFARPRPEEPGDDQKVALIFVIEGQTGRPVSAFAFMHSHEQEILFANGTPMTVVGISPEFHDKDLGPTRIVLLRED